MDKFRNIEEIKAAKRRGENLSNLYQRLSSSQELLQEQKQTAFQILSKLYLTRLDVPTAKEIVELDVDTLELNELDKLEPEVAEILTTTFYGSGLSFNGLKTLSVELARVLSRWEGPCLSLDGLEDLEISALKSLSQWKCENGLSISLNGLKTLRPEIAEIFSNWGDIDEYQLNGLTQISLECIKYFSNWGGHLSLNGLKTLEPAMMKALLANYDCSLGLSLDGLTTLELELAEILSQHYQIYELSLNGLKKPSIEILKVLSQYQGLTLSLNGIEKLELEQAEIFSQFKVEMLELNGLKEIELETAKILCRWNGRILSLNGLEILEEKLAYVLSQWSPGKTYWRLYMEGIKKLPKNSAFLLALFKGELNLPLEFEKLVAKHQQS